MFKQQAEYFVPHPSIVPHLPENALETFEIPEKYKTTLEHVETLFEAEENPEELRDDMIGQNEIDMEEIEAIEEQVEDPIGQIEVVLEPAEVPEVQADDSNEQYEIVLEPVDAPVEQNDEPIVHVETVLDKPIAPTEEIVGEKESGLIERTFDLKDDHPDHSEIWKTILEKLPANYKIPDADFIASLKKANRNHYGIETVEDEDS